MRFATAQELLTWGGEGGARTRPRLYTGSNWRGGYGRGTSAGCREARAGRRARTALRCSRFGRFPHVWDSMTRSSAATCPQVTVLSRLTLSLTGRHLKVAVALCGPGTRRLERRVPRVDGCRTIMNASQESSPGTWTSPENSAPRLCSGGEVDATRCQERSQTLSHRYPSFRSVPAVRSTRRSQPSTPDEERCRTVTVAGSIPTKSPRVRRRDVVSS